MDNLSARLLRPVNARRRPLAAAAATCGTGCERNARTGEGEVKVGPGDGSN